ncbi:MAG: hypothetical protein DPW18_10605 [Chloroflexi bacterium]|nr:hypothetical protein [Chloroflexota bacterium]MDL1943941.1 hypothetical protein [Chloroflexi bacterium CFX2]
MKNKIFYLIIPTLILSVTFFLQEKKNESVPITIVTRNSYVRMSLDDLISEADLIVAGNVDTIYGSRWNSSDGKKPGGDAVQRLTPDDIIFTDIDFHAAQLLKGDIQQKTVRIRFLGGKVDNVQMMTDEAILEVNKTYLLFLDLDTRGLTADIVPGHYRITGGRFQGVYEIKDDRAISENDEWSLNELIAYIQNSPLSVTSPVLSDTPEIKEVIRVVETAYDVEAEASYSFNTEKFPSVFVNDINRVVAPEKMEFVRFFISNPDLETPGYLDYKIAYYNWWKDSAMRFEDLKEKAGAENREITQEEINALIDSKWGMAPARAENPQRKGQLKFISVEIIGDTASAYVNDGFQVIVLYLVNIDGEWYISGDKENTIFVETFAPVLTPVFTETPSLTDASAGVPTETPYEIPGVLITKTPVNYPSAPVVPVSAISGDISALETRKLIASKLAVIWLDSYTSNDLPDNFQLQEYRINYVDIVKGPLECLPGDYRDEFRIEINFDAKLIDYLHNHWLAGGGNFDFDSMWIVGKSVYPLVFREGDIYTWDGKWDCTISYP